MIQLLLSAALTLCGASAFAVLAHTVARRYGLTLQTRTPAAFVAIAGGAIGPVLLVSHESIWYQAAIAIAGCCCALSAITDSQTGYIFDALSGPTLCITVVCNALSGGLGASLFGVAYASAPLLALYVLSGRRGLGLGDVKLAACIGAALGPVCGLDAVGAAFVIGGCWGAYLLISRKASRGAVLHFAPYLCAGMALLVLYREAA